MSKKLIVGLSCILLLSSGLLANGLNLNGFGARAAAMGGAFVGLADDFTAVFWNPAGLARMTKGTFGVTGDFLMPRGTYGFGDFSMKTEGKTYPAGLLGYFHPISDRIVIGVGAYTLSGLGADWVNPGLEAAFISPLPPEAFTPPVEPYTWKSFIGSVTVAPTVAFKLTDQIFLGATFNINYGFFQTKQWGEYTFVPLGAPAAPAPGEGVLAAPGILFNFGQASLNVHGWGFGATIGLLVEPIDQVSFGITYRTETKMKMKGTTELENLPLLDPGLSDASDAEMTVYSPMWLAGGLAVRPVENLTVTFDLQWTNWSKLTNIDVVFLDSGWNTLGIMGNTLYLDWKNEIQIRAGLEYTLGNLALRAGYYYDPAPAPDSTLNILVPSFTYNSITGGVGYRSGDFRLDFGLEYLIGQNRAIAPSEDNMPGNYSLKILVPMFSLSYGW